MRVAAIGGGNTFFFLLHRHLVILAKNRTSFRGNVAAKRAKEKESEREKESAPKWAATGCGTNCTIEHGDVDV